MTRVYLPPDANTLLVVADKCLRSSDCINVIVADKQKHLQFVDIEAAVLHCAKGIGIWQAASNDEGVEPDVVMACCGDVATQEALAATGMLREHLPRFEGPFRQRGRPVQVTAGRRASARLDRPGVRQPVHHRQTGDLQFPWLSLADPQKLAYRFKNHENLHVRGYKERGNINTPLELAILNQTDRFTLVIDVIDRVPGLAARAAHLREQMKNEINRNLTYAHEQGTDRDEFINWVWPLSAKPKTLALNVAWK